MSEAPGSHYAADFTSAKAAKEGTCENCGTTAVLKHMQNKDRSKLGRDLCPNCYQYYRNKNGTIRRSSAQTPWVEHSASHQHDVHKQVAQAQRGRESQYVSSFERLTTHIPSGVSDVQAVGGSNHVMEQVHPAGYMINTSSGPLSTPGPSVHLPGNIPQHTNPPSMHLPKKGQPQAVGYTQAYAAYPAERHERIQQAYSTHNGEVVVIEVRMVVMPPGRVQMQLIHVRSLPQVITSESIYVN